MPLDPALQEKFLGVKVLMSVELKVEVLLEEDLILGCGQGTLPLMEEYLDLVQVC